MGGGGSGLRSVRNGDFWWMKIFVKFNSVAMIKITIDITTIKKTIMAQTTTMKPTKTKTNTTTTRTTRTTRQPQQIQLR